MMKTKLIKSAGTFLLSALIVTGLNAQSPRNTGMGSGPYGQGNCKMGQQLGLDLSEEQQVEMNSLKTAHYTTMKPLRYKMRELKAREATLLSEKSVDMKVVNKLIDEQTDLMNSMRKLQVEQKVAVKNILTDEQEMKLEQRKNFGKHKRGMRNDFHRGTGNDFQRGNRMNGPYHKNIG